MTKHQLRHEGATATTIKCPVCGDIIVYNGNYFCNSFDAFEVRCGDVYLNEGTCTWALPHPATSNRDKKVIDQLFESGYLTNKDYA